MIKSIYKISLVLLIIATLVLASCTGKEKVVEKPPPSTPVEPTTPSEKAEDTREEYTHQILATGELGINEYSTKPPGQSSILPREYPGAPPLIPHSPSGLTITKDRNPCLGCHIQGVSLGPDHTATKIPESHYIDIPTGEKSQDIQPIRYNCTICHIPQSSETPPSGY